MVFGTTEINDGFDILICFGMGVDDAVMFGVPVETVVSTSTHPVKNTT